MTVADRRARFRALHAGEELFVMPNPWDIGSAKLLAECGFQALATTSAGYAWALGKLDQQVTRDELVEHVARVAEATSLPLNVDSERCYPDDPGGVAETVRLLAEAGAAGFSIEDWNPATGRIDDLEVAAERVAIAAEAAHALAEPMVLTGRAENHLHGVDDLAREALAPQPGEARRAPDIGGDVPVLRQQRGGRLDLAQDRSRAEELHPQLAFCF